jgi:hypothetical protein
MATAQEVESFLQELRVCVDFGTPVQFRRTPKNVQGLIDLNMTEAQAIHRIKQLTPFDYCLGPEPDSDEDGKEIWVFGCVEGGVEVYVKLRLDTARPFSRPVVRSFHPAEHPLAYPHKKGGGS